MFKKFIVLVIALVLFSPVYIKADKDNSTLINDEVNAIVSGTCGESVTWEFDSVTKMLTISGSGEMDDFSYNSSPWYTYRKIISQIVVEDNVSNIGNYAFYEFESLKDIKIGNGVQTIGTSAFWQCYSLTSIVLPENLTDIKDHAFSFDNGIKEIAMSDKVEHIEDGAFFGCSSLALVNIPNSVISIGDYAFCGCESLREITIGNNCKTIGKHVFTECNTLTGIFVNANNTAFSSNDGVLFNNDQSTLVYFPSGKTNSYIIPDSVINIGNGAFYSNEMLENVVIPDSVISISEDAFGFCISLKDIIIGQGLMTIDKAAFYGCSALVNIALSDNIISIGDNAFYDCYSLEKIVLPKSIISVGSSAFYNCKSITDVYYYGTESDWSSIDFSSFNDSLLTARIHYYRNWDTDHIEWIWTAEDTDEKFSVQAVFSSKDDKDYKEVVDAKIKSIISEATCDKEGEIIYYAEVWFWNNTYTDTKTIKIPSLGHNYELNKWNWEGNEHVGYTKAEAVFVCTNDSSHVQTVPTEVTVETTEATCENTGKTVYTATVTFERKEYTDKKEVVIAAIGHKYGEPTYTWTSDNSQVTAIVVCENDSEHRVIETVDTSYDVTKEASCEEKGIVFYTATFTNEFFTNQTKEVEIPALGHQFVLSDWQWSDYDVDTTPSVKAVFTCEHDNSHVQSVDAESVTKKVVDPTFNATGAIIYTAEVTGPDGQKYTDTKTILIDKNRITRLYGTGRYETSLLMADTLRQEMGIEKFDSVVVAYGGAFPDALAGSYLAAAKSAPIILVGKSARRITPAVDYIKQNLKAGGTVYILGGISAVPEDVDKALSGFNVQRLAGAERYETNTLILKTAGVKDGDEVIVCTGKDYADSLSVSSVGKPILLVKSKLTTAQINLLKSLKNLKFTIIGGENAVTKDMENTLKSYGTINERLAGKNRFDTSIKVAEKYFNDPETVTLVYSHDFPDGLSAGSYAYYKKSPTILTRTKTPGLAQTYVQSLTNLKAGYVVGGEGLISDATIQTIFGLEDVSDIITVYRE